MSQIPIPLLGVAIGDTITDATEGSVLFAGAAGVLAQNNTAFKWVNAATQLQLTAGGATKTPLYIKLAGSQTADAFQVYASDDTTKYVSLSPTANGLLQFYGIGSGEDDDWAGISRSGNGALQIFHRAVSADEGMFLYASTTEGIRMASTLQYGWSSGLPSAAANDTGLGRSAAGVIKITDGSTGIRGFLGGGTSVASATALPTPTGRIFHVTGTTNITSITSTAIGAGCIITLVFDGVLTVTDGNNLKLAGDFITTADDTLTLGYDGTNWYEIARSAN